MTAIKLDYVKHFYSRHGKPIYQFRPPQAFAHLGLTRLPGKPGSKDFQQAYAEALERVELARAGMIGEKRAKPGSMAALIGSYYGSAAFTTLAPKAQSTYRQVIDPIRERDGDRMVRDLTRDKVEAMLSKRAETPATANLWLRQMRMLMKLAIRKGMRADDPTAGVAKIEYAAKPHKTWTEDHIGAFEAKFPIGSKPRLALALLLYTGCRREDVVSFGPSNIHRGADGRQWLTYVQNKNKLRKPVTVTLPVADELRRIIAATPVVGTKTFLVNANGSPFAHGASFGNWMRAQTKSAGLDECSPHGLRKAICRRLVRLGMKPHDIMAVTGHKTLAQVQHYCEEFERELAAERSIAALNSMQV
jgi:integrase